MNWPRSLNELSKPSLLFSLCRSSTLVATTWPLKFCHGPLPMRSRALTAGSSLLGAQIGAPSFPSGAVTLRQHLAMLVGAFDAAQIGALAGPGAGDEECHIGRLRQLWWRRLLLLCIDSRRYTQCQRRNNKCVRLAHFSPPLGLLISSQNSHLLLLQA
jgi:hypothetical protein